MWANILTPKRNETDQQHQLFTFPIKCCSSFCHNCAIASTARRMKRTQYCPSLKSRGHFLPGSSSFWEGFISTTCMLCSAFACSWSPFCFRIDPDEHLNDDYF
ncbi:hypothetical protein CEXT_302041 [Caerostris extrusa]|uniref:Uncharacterized protein n=1 Tax=Caerostris extrusa TaxID=172846 RepID=A0AAV4VI50_CAEEX|nr:hypothetical protein CEXT_302041 [Caerostris extrusa]